MRVPAGLYDFSPPQLPGQLPAYDYEDLEDGDGEA